MDQTKAYGQVESAIPGRMRIRIDPARRVLMPEIRAQLEAQPGITRVEARPATGSVVVEYHQPTVSRADVLSMLHAIGMPVRDRAEAEPTVGPPKGKRGEPRTADQFEEDRGMVGQAGPLVVDWPRSIGYFGAVTLAVALELVPLPIGAFIAVIPFLKLLKRSSDSRRTRFVAAVFEGAAIPVGGQSESFIRLARNASKPS